jgi:hypothetical protein
MSKSRHTTTGITRDEFFAALRRVSLPEKLRGHTCDVLGCSQPAVVIRYSSEGRWYYCAAHCDTARGTFDDREEGDDGQEGQKSQRQRQEQE